MVNKPVNKVQPSDRLTELDLTKRNRGDIAASSSIYRVSEKTQDGEAQSDLSTPATDDELDIWPFYADKRIRDHKIKFFCYIL